ncbi:hypothetical protein MTO96_011386 [Rhipicephalus appendiculatus]
MKIAHLFIIAAALCVVCPGVKGCLPTQHRVLCDRTGFYPEETCPDADSPKCQRGTHATTIDDRRVKFLAHTDFKSALPILERQPSCLVAPSSLTSGAPR